MYIVPMYPYPYYPAAPSYGYRGEPINQQPSFPQENAGQMFSPYFAGSGPNMNHQAEAAMHIPSEERQSMDVGSRPYVVNIHQAARQNNTFRTAIWTGEYLQVVIMSIQPGDDIGLEVHRNHDQFLRIEEGEGITRMGDTQHNLDFEERISRGSAIMVPAGKWHNIINTGNRPLKLYTIYAPPEHEYGTVHETKKAAMAAEGHHN
ncbi:cupin domain-containing protein [Virgibacillus sp. YIM 98842]|uniref:cupin domain-containing protein n=1 Tax=Virgibacillus sp. YIM 98842 TaxID=2663533 RepID=UPI001F08A062|nr:cupin domain-containing protein [Virgibacillus sp. YIM 98842]